MTVWVVRGGRYGEREAEALDRSVLTIGFGLLGYLSDVAGREGFTDVLRELHGGLLHQIGNYSCQVRSFVEGIQADDLVVMPRKGTGLLAMGVFAGGYLYRSDKGDFAHGRRVQWLNTEVSRDLLEGDLKSSISANSSLSPKDAILSLDLPPPAPGPVASTLQRTRPLSISRSTPWARYGPVWSETFTVTG